MYAFISACAGGVYSSCVMEQQISIVIGNRKKWRNIEISLNITIKRVKGP